ncbi:MAG TPA: glycosyltransferase N-terminal domain-containing protein [Bacteroidota bacterium]|jgi:3-deoxy-D-manno-octulosonic-acid transferase|nr:glycosyltransferase N-terminal domain-containing protein [Bacteroidota bacterium]
MFWRLFYNTLIVPLGWIGFRVVGLFNHKVKHGIRARKNLFRDLQERFHRLDPGSRRIWFHSSSLGEFEQGKPIIAALKKLHPDIKIIVSFFSPSGYEHSRNYKLADVITYIPFDSRRNARKFVGLIDPSIAIMLRYDVWPNHLWALQSRGTPTFIASATLQSRTARKFPVIRQFYAAMYNCIDFILTVSADDRRIFESFRLEHPVLEVIGDTRYDQVLQRSEESKARQLLPEDVVCDRKILVIGSSWTEDEQELLPACFSLTGKQPEMLVIVVPHEPTVEHLERLENDLNGKATHIRFSEVNDYHNEKVVIVDSVGVLMPLYQYASVAYVGGGFGTGVHNVLEPASYGVPIIVGPNHANSQEAVRFVREGAAFVAVNKEELVLQLERLFEDDDLRRTAGEKAKKLVQSNSGATERFLSYLEKLL